MSPDLTHAETRAPSRRELGVDLARGVAVVSMFVAHTAPGAGPGDVLMLSEFLTFPLFALLVGAGTELGARALGPAAHAVASFVRASALLALGWALAQAGAHIVIVLAPLGVLTLLCWAVSRLPTTLVLGVAVIAGLVAPWTIEASRSTWIQLAVDGETGKLWWFDLLVSNYYPQAVLLLCGCVGILLVRLLLPPQGQPVGLTLPAGLLVGCIGVVGLLSWARLTGRVDLVAYETTWSEELFVTALATGVFVACLLVARWPVSRVLRPLAWVGGMTLTVYSLQVVWLAWWARGLFPGTPDDAWANVVGMTLVAVLVAALWRRFGLPAPWRRGPLEGVVGTGVASALRLLPGHDPDRVPAVVSPTRTEVGEPLERR
ncbi:DUF418 domain-containing protein [Nocardioides sp. Y6]|uniref:DUF418 domain-containing protein n=1 Tax=Nocardioides malaquae TaxID=2773426 RepID=A0ABR9RU27_9ACTN|nr:DUF418 domain-containing protein [Nocardioides malaquae]MBE7325056.1 DUF418 domain-containing protein [Nocardioides malaquae]